MPKLIPAARPSDPTATPPHELESDVRRKLMSEDSFNFSSLVVRRVADGVCLEGVLEVDDEDVDVTAAALEIAGVVKVQNHLLIRQTSREKQPLPEQPTPRRRPR